jgi:hypothetical protein
MTLCGAFSMKSADQGDGYPVSIHSQRRLDCEDVWRCRFQTAIASGRSVLLWGSTTTFVPMGTAKGAGQWVDPPKLFGIKAGGGACLGAKGGSEGIVVIAHYRHQQ